MLRADPALHLTHGRCCNAGGAGFGTACPLGETLLIFELTGAVCEVFLERLVQAPGGNRPRRFLTSWPRWPRWAISPDKPGQNRPLREFYVDSRQEVLCALQFI